IVADPVCNLPSAFLRKLPASQEESTGKRRWTDSGFWIASKAHVVKTAKGNAPFLNLLRLAWIEYERDRAQYLAVAMIYYAMVSLIPLSLLLLAALGLLLRVSPVAADIQEQLLRHIEASFGAPLRVTIGQLLHTLEQGSILATAVSLVGL